MTFEVRAADPSEIDRIIELDGIVFNNRVDDHTRGAAREFLDDKRLFVLVDDGQLVGCSANLSLELTVPGGAGIPMTGVTWVAVLPTHHRRGGLTLMMDKLLRDGREHGEPVAGLYASESPIYRRFGYGVASRMATTTIEVRHSGLRSPRARSGSMELVPMALVEPVLTPLIDSCRRTRNGMVSRPANLVKSSYMYPPDGTLVNVAVHRNIHGDVDGVLRYAAHSGHDADWLPRAEIRVSELWALTPDVEVDLWQYATGLDFARTVTALDRPVTEPIVDLAVDARRWQSLPRDGLHLRTLDVDRLLGTRRYLRDGSVVLEVLAPDGKRTRHLVTGGPDGAESVATDKAADLVLDLASLGAVYLGDVPIERLGRAGLVEEGTPGAIERATAMFLWGQEPWSGYVF